MVRTRRQRARRARFSSVQARMVGVFLLLTLAVMATITVGLLGAIRSYYVRTDQHLMLTNLQGLQQALGTKLAEVSSPCPPGAPAGSGTGSGRTSSAASSTSAAGPGTGANCKKAALTIQQVAQAMQGVLLTYSGTVELLDAPQLVCEVSTAGCAQTPAFPQPTVADLEQGKAQQCSEPGPGGGQEIWCGMPVLNPGNAQVAAYLLAWTPEDSIYATIHQIRDILLTWTLVALAMMGLLSLLLARTITGPIQALTRRARTMAAGDFGGRMPVQGRDEVGQLAFAFNQMARRLQETLDEIRAEQRRAAAILNNMTDGIVALDAQGTIMLCNPVAALLLGIEPAAVLGKPAGTALPAPLADALPPPGPPRLPDSAGDEDVATVPGIPIQAEGRQLLVHVAPLTGGGASRGTVIVLQDVTARERLDALRKEFVANVSHELRTPVTTIKLYAESLLDWGLEDPEAARPKIEVIAEETDRMDRLIRDLLQLSRLDHRREARDRRPTDLAAVVGSVVARLKPGAVRKGVQLRLECASALPPVPADADGIVQVVTNLLTNAIDFTPSGGSVTVSVGAERDSARVDVVDTGSGIPSADVPRIFDRFYRVDTSRSREHGGSGLGLSIAKELVEQHGGTIGADSAAGQGSRFWFTLPLGGAP